MASVELLSDLLLKRFLSLFCCKAVVPATLGIVNRGVIKAVSSNKVKRFFIVTATILPPNPLPLRGAELRSAPCNSAGFAPSLLLSKESRMATDGHLMTKTKDPPFPVGLQPKAAAAEACEILLHLLLEESQSEHCFNYCSREDRVCLPCMFQQTCQERP